MVAERCVTGHSVYVMDRGCLTRIGQLGRLTSVQYERDRDATSEATVVLTGNACRDQRGLINRIISKRHELLIFRGNKRVWEGPIFRIGDQGDRVSIWAKDVSAYLFGTPLTKDWDNRDRAKYDIDGNEIERYSSPTEVTTRIGDIIEYEMTHNWTARSIKTNTQIPIVAWENLSPPANVVPHMVVHHFPNEARTATFTHGKEMTVGTHLQTLSQRSGIDWTVIGRAIHIWDVSRNIGHIRTLTEADFHGYTIVSEYGADHTQLAYVTSGSETSTEEDDFTYGEAVNPENLDLYGPWTTVYTAYNESSTNAPTTPELNSQASRNTSGRSPVPVEVRVPDNSTIRLSETLTIDDLVPGVQVPLRATLNTRAWSQMQKLDRVRVTETAEGEKVQITLTPATRPDSDEED